MSLESADPGPVLSGGATELSLEDRFSRWAGENGSGGESFDVLIARLRQHEPHNNDFRPHFRAQSAPGLWLYGGKDRSNPSILCKEMIEEIATEYARDPTNQAGTWRTRHEAALRGRLYSVRFKP